MSSCRQQSTLYLINLLHDDCHRRFAALLPPVGLTGEVYVMAGDVLDGLRAALDALVDADGCDAADGGSVVALLGELARLEAVVCARLAAFDTSGDWTADGAQNAVAWVCTRARVERRVTRRRLRVGRHLAAMDTVRAAFAAGVISLEHVELLVAARNRSRVTAMIFGRDEELLVGWASSLKFHQFRHVLGEWVARADEEAAEDRADRQRDGRRFHLSRSLHDMWFADGVLDPVSGDIINRVLSNIEQELFETDWGAARDRLGREPSVSELARTAAQRRAEALVEMAIRAATAPADGRRPAPVFTVLMGAEMFARTCELASGTILTPGTVARWAHDAEFERVLFDGPDRVLSVSHRRNFTGALRRAIEVRDRTCTHPYCDTDAEHCQIDHIRPWAAGGETSIDNGRLRCGHHNRLGVTRPETANPKTDPVFHRTPNQQTAA
jgi:Domain of unknown function (DUF222)